MTLPHVPHAHPAQARLRPYTTQIAHDLKDHLVHALADQPQGDAAKGWLAQALADASCPGAAESGVLLTQHARAARHLRRLHAELPPALHRSLFRRGVHAPQSWSAVDCARVLLTLLALGRLPMHAHVAFVRQLFLKGDSDERRALLQGLVLLPEPVRFTELAIDACRSSVRSVFDAIASDNQFPARYFPDAAFHQLVLKALSVELPIERLVGLSDRFTRDLRRMVSEYASERRAAGRAVSADTQGLLDRLAERSPLTTPFHPTMPSMGSSPRSGDPAS